MAFPQPKSIISPEAYLEWERERPGDKHEFWDGQIYDMPGGSPEHALIISNLLRTIFPQAAKQDCRVYTSDLRVQVPSFNYVYPDVTIVCGKPEFVGTKKDNLENPTMIIEVLSPSTKAFDRGEKFYKYRLVDSLQVYVLVSQDQPLVEVFARQGKQWVLTETIGLKSSLTIPHLDYTLDLESVYQDVSFEGETL